MTKLYMIEWGYYSDLSGESSIDSIWSSEEKALNHIKSKVETRNLTQNTRPDLNKHLWTNGDYWTSISEVNLDNEFLYSYDD